MYETINDIKLANAAGGFHFFSPDTMRFFRCRVLDGVYGGRYFVTSEQMDTSSPRLYTIRMARADGSVDTVGEFGAFATREAAVSTAKILGAETL